MNTESSSIDKQDGKEDRLKPTEARVGGRAWIGLAVF